MKTITRLINEASNIIKKHEQIRIENGDEFNIFKITGIQSDEVKMCRMLAEIIDPTGSHNQGVFFISSFVENVLKIEMTKEELKTTRVYVEYHTGADRRIDIAIVTNKRFIPIEVKIYAEDQTRQCKDYYDFALSQKKSEVSKVYYLTLDGHLPQKSGSEGLTSIEEGGSVVGYEEIVAISFKNEICSWLEKCLEEKELSEKNMLRTNIEQFLYVLGELSGSMTRKQNEEISRLISSDSDKFAAASAIAENVQEAKKEKLLDLFSRIESQLNLLGFPYEMINEKSYKHDNYEAIEKFYGGRKTWPSLTYRYKKIDDTKEIWFRIEVDYNLYCGFVLAENNENTLDASEYHELIKEQIETPHGFEDENWWFYWEYLLNDDTDSTPNFVNTNDVMIKLFDREYFGWFVEKCTERIIGLTEEMKLK